MFELAIPGAMEDVKIFVSPSSSIDEDGVSCAHVPDVPQSAKVSNHFISQQEALLLITDTI